jgi:hypothetical protein
MSRLLYGSSNVYRNFSRSTLVADHGLVLVDCTKKALFDTHLASLGTLSSGSLIVTSVLENFIMDVCRDLEPSEANLFARQQITVHVEAVASAVRDVSDTVAIVSSLLRRRTPSKFVFSGNENDRNSLLVFSLSLHKFRSN